MLRQQDNSKRQLLRVAAKIMVSVGLLALVLVLFSSMGSNKALMPEMPPMVVDVGQVTAGDALFTVWAERPVIIYHRQRADINALGIASQPLAVSAKESEASKYAYPDLRSQTPEWFVAFANGTDLSCPIKLLPAGDNFQGRAWRGGFVDTCRGSRYDFAGRVFSNQHASRNLVIPDYSFSANGELLLGVSR